MGAVAALALTVVAAKAQAVNCPIDFNNYNALSALPDKAGFTFVVPPYYKHPCSDGALFTVDDRSNIPEYHLSFENACATCIGTNRSFGLDRACMGTGTGCQDIDAAAFPRYLSTHLSNQLIGIAGTPATPSWCSGGACTTPTTKIFRANSIQIKGSQAVQVILVVLATQVISTPGGPRTVVIQQARTFRNLTAGTWALGATQNVVQALIASDNSTTGRPFSFDNFYVTY